MKRRESAAISSLRFSLLLNDNFPDHSTGCAGIRKIDGARSTVEYGLMTLDLKVTDPVDHFPILHDDELVAIRVGDIERIGLFVHRETGAHSEVQAAPVFEKFSGLCIPDGKAGIVGMMIQDNQ